MHSSKFARKEVQIILLVLIVLGLLLVATYHWWLPRVDAAYLLWPVRHDAAIQTVAKPLALASAPATGSAYTLGALALRAPWSDQSRIDTIPGYSIIARFGGGGAPDRTLVLLQDPSLRESFASHDPSMQQFFDTTLTTNYAAYTYLMQTTPADIDYFSLAGDPYHEALLLLFKDEMFIGGGPVWSFTTGGGMRGFLSYKNATTTVAEFFAPNDQEYTLILGGATQSEAEAILQSAQEH